MKKFFTFLFFTFTVVSCSNFDDPVSSDEENSNLLFSASFENGLENWNSPGAPHVKIVSNPAPGGGELSVLLKSEFFSGTINTSIPLPQNKNIYRFSFWAKIGNGNAQAYLYLKSNNKKIFNNRIFISDTAWTRYVLRDTLNSAPGDSLQVVFIGSDSEAGLNKTWVDLCLLEKIN